jgi:hypothetical protein
MEAIPFALEDGLSPQSLRLPQSVFKGIHLLEINLAKINLY